MYISKPFCTLVFFDRLHVLKSGKSNSPYKTCFKIKYVLLCIFFTVTLFANFALLNISLFVFEIIHCCILVFKKKVLSNSAMRRGCKLEATLFNIIKIPVICFRAKALWRCQKSCPHTIDITLL